MSFLGVFFLGGESLRFIKRSGVAGSKFSLFSLWKEDLKVILGGWGNHSRLGSLAKQLGDSLLHSERLKTLNPLRFPSQG